MEEFTEGQDPVALPHEVQALPGNKFAPRMLSEAGDYYVRVRANHPEYKLRTRVYDPPPYNDPQQAVRTAVDYILARGRFVARQYAAARRTAGSRGERASGNVAVRGLPRQPFFAARAALCGGERISGGAARSS